MATTTSALISCQGRQEQDRQRLLVAQRHQTKVMVEAKAEVTTMEAMMGGATAEVMTMAGRKEIRGFHAWN